MADVYAAQAENKYNTTPPDIASPFYAGTDLEPVHDTYEASSAAAGTDIVILEQELQAGSGVHDVRIIHDALGASTTLAVALRDADGNETTVVSAQSTSSAGVITPDSSDVGSIPAEVTEPSDLIVKIAGGTATGTINFYAAVSRV